MHKYEIVIYWSNEDGVFVAEAPELRRWRVRPTAARRRRRWSRSHRLELWLETAREFGDPIPEPKGERVMPA